MTGPALLAQANADLAAALSDLVQQLLTDQVRGYAVETAAGLLDISPRAVDQLIRDKKLGFVWAGKRRVVPHAELQRFLATGVLAQLPAA